MKAQKHQDNMERLGIQPPHYRLAEQSHVGKVTSRFPALLRPSVSIAM